jgi:uncharacterized protein (TIGR03435 family)
VLTLADYAEYLSAATGRPVVDETSIEGQYQFDDWVLQRAAMTPTAGVEPYGRKLEPRKSTLPVLVIDHINRVPMGN